MFISSNDYNSQNGMGQMFISSNLKKVGKMKVKMYISFGDWPKNTKRLKHVWIEVYEWWFVDTGYLSSQITRYPEPKINDYDSTYFRIIKGGIHTNRFHVATPDRWNVLIKQGIDAEFKGWRDSGDYIIMSIFSYGNTSYKWYHTRRVALASYKRIRRSL